MGVFWLPPIITFYSILNILSEPSHPFNVFPSNNWYLEVFETQEVNNKIVNSILTEINLVNFGRFLIKTKFYH